MHHLPLNSRRRRAAAWAAVALAAAARLAVAQEPRPAGPPAATAAAAADSLAKRIAGTYLSSGARGSVVLRSVGRGVVTVERGGAWDAAGFWDGRAFNGVVRSLRHETPGASPEFGVLVFEAASGESLRAEIRLEGRTWNETWWPAASRAEPPAESVKKSAADADPKPGEYVYVEELPEAIRRTAPAYPPEARARGIEGVVTIQALVGRDGSVKDARVVESIPGLDAAALASVRQWTFKPARAKGAAVAVWVAIPVKFSLR